MTWQAAIPQQLKLAVSVSWSPSYFQIYNTTNHHKTNNTELHADYGDMVEIETGCRIPIWRTLVFPNRKLRTVVEIWFALCR